MKVSFLILTILFPIIAAANSGGSFVGKNRNGITFDLYLDCESVPKNIYQQKCTSLGVFDQKRPDDLVSIKVNCIVDHPKYIEFTSITCGTHPSKEYRSKNSRLSKDKYLPLSNVRYEIDRELIRKKKSYTEIFRCKYGCNEFIPEILTHHPGRDDA